MGYQELENQAQIDRQGPSPVYGVGQIGVTIPANTTLTAVIDATFAKDTRIYSGTDATIAVEASNSGTTYIATKGSATQTFTLPAASTTGLEYTFICGNVGGEIKILGVAGDTINCKTAAQGTSLSIAADTGVKNTAATNVLGDTITLVSDGTTTWWMHAQSGIFASN